MRRWGWLILSLCVALPLVAQDVPPPLRDWQGWVLHDVPQHACPFLANQNPGEDSYQCIWPGQLTVDARKDGGHFAFAVHVDAAGWVALPGDQRAWPQQVTASNKPLPVLNQDGVPQIWLQPGDYDLQGNLPWVDRPAGLRVPLQIGLVALSVDGAAVAHMERNGDQLTLGEAAAAQRTADALSVRVYRRLTDGMPPDLATEVQLNVTGSAREQMLGPALPKGFVATALSGDLPARLESDGRLRVQLRAGQWTLHLRARGSDTLHKVALTSAATPWPQQEVWSYADDPAFRGTRVEGRATDANQADVPYPWRQLPAYAMDDNNGLDIKQGVRGSEGAQADQLHDAREMWLDFDGHGLTVSDHLTGSLRQHQRLDVAAPWQLQRATQSDSPLLITSNSSGQTGVELRDTPLDLQAGLGLADHSGALPSAGWLIPLESINATLHLPYGYRLLGSTGVDHSPDSWVAQWTLLDLFVVALIALLAGRLLGWPWALLAIGFLVLSQHEVGAPRWTIGAAIAVALLVRALPEGRLRFAARIAASVLLALTVLWTLPFAAAQMKYALHPQLESSRVDAAPMLSAAQNYGAPAEMVAAPAPPPAVEEASNLAAPPIAMKRRMPATASQQLSTVAVTAESLMPSQTVANLTDTHSVIQAGNGTPQWDVGNNYRLSWSGPITPAQTTRLMIAPSWLVRVLRVLMLCLLLTLLVRVAKLLMTPWAGRLSGLHARPVAAMLLFLSVLPYVAHAQAIPNQNLLDQLRNRLTEAPKCAPSCAVLAAATVQANGDQVSVSLDADIGATVAFPLPQTDGNLQLLGVTADGHPNTAVANRDNQAMLRLDTGVHHLVLTYHAQAADTVIMHFALPPQWVSFAGQDWSLAGVDAGRMLGDSLTLNRVRTATDGQPAVAVAQTFPPYVRVTRKLVFGLDWTVENTVERIAPQDGGFSLDVPLLPGEHPLGDNARVHDGRIGITFNADDNQVSWTSRLDHSGTLALKAPSLADRSEVWQLLAAPIWHLQTAGVPVGDTSEGLSFQPLPGETLHVTVTQPQAIGGDSIAFDSVQLTSVTGDRASESTLSLNARSTRGGEHAIALPDGVELLSAARDGQTINLALHDGKISLPLLPETHQYELRLREPGGVAARIQTAAIGLGAPAANISLHLQLPQDRWVLWTWGPTNGPAVLYWSQLVVLLLAAWALARYAPTPLRFHQWLLLGLGFSAFAWSAYAIVVVWLILLGVRARQDTALRFGARTFNAVQLGLAVITGIALLVLMSAIPKGLLGQPDMHVEGNNSSAWALNWFADQSADTLPRAGVLSVSFWVYKIAMLAWALWLANALIGWLRWGFEAWTRGGYWRKPVHTPAVPPALPTKAPEPPTDG